MIDFDELKKFCKEDLESWAECEVAGSLHGICDWDPVASEIVNTNATGWNIEDFHVQHVEIIGAELRITVEYSLTGHQEDDKAWRGNRITGIFLAIMDAAGEISHTKVTAKRDFERKIDKREEEEVYQAEPPQPTVIADINVELKNYLAKHPEKLYNLTSRKFEELIADILKDLGFDTELTSATRDGGRDIYAYMRNSVTSFLTFVECKKWAEHNKVGIDIVQRLHGAAKASGAHKSMIVTTSLFTLPAQQERAKIANEMELKDYNDLKTWLSKYK